MAIVVASVLLAWFATRMIRLFFFRDHRWGTLLAIATTLALFCVKPVLDRLVFRVQLDAFAADEIRPETLTLPPGDLLWIQSRSASYICYRRCPLEDLAFVTRVEIPNAYELRRDPANPAILDLWQFFKAPDRTRPFGFRYAFIDLGAVEYANAVGIPEARQETWPRFPLSAYILVEVPQSGLLDLQQARTHYRRFVAGRDAGTFLLLGGLFEEWTVMPDIGAEIDALVRVSRAE